MNKHKTVKELNALARGQLIGRYSSTIIVCLTVSLLNVFAATLGNSASYTSISSYIVSLVISLIVDLLCGVLIMGQNYFFLKIVRFDQTASVSDIFYGFRTNVDKAIFIQMFFTGTIFIASLPALLINLGIITYPITNPTAFNIGITIFESALLFVVRLYLGLSFYILCDHPEFTVKQVISESVRLMTNQKGRLFLTCLSLVPLFFLGAFACGIGLLWVAVFKETLLADFYLDVIGEEPATAPKAPDSDHPDYSI